MVYLDSWKKAFTYKGRDDKREFWLPFLVNTLIGIGLLVLVKLTHSALTWLPLLWAGLAFIPTAAAAARRMRDFGAPLSPKKGCDRGMKAKRGKGTVAK